MGQQNKMPKEVSPLMKKALVADMSKTAIAPAALPERGGNPPISGPTAHYREAKKEAETITKGFRLTAELDERIWQFVNDRKKTDRTMSMKKAFSEAFELLFEHYKTR